MRRFNRLGVPLALAIMACAFGVSAASAAPCTFEDPPATLGAVPQFRRHHADLPHLSGLCCRASRATLGPGDETGAEDVTGCTDSPAGVRGASAGSQNREHAL